MSRPGLRRALSLVGWGLFLGALVALWRDPGLLQRLRLGGRGGAAPDAPCELASGQRCSARFSDGLQVALSVGGVGLQPGREVDWTVTVDDPQARVQGLELTGVNMPMGLTTLPLSPGPQAGTWRARGSLPLCTTSQMLWRADVLLEAGGRARVAGFQFWTQGPQAGATEAEDAAQAGRGAAAQAGRGAAAQAGRGAAAPGAPPPTFGDFTVQTAQGPLALSDLRGQVVLLYFGYTACPDICPTTLSTLAAAVRQLDPADQERVTGLLLSLDPARDTLPRLDTYTRHFHPRFRGGTTEEAELDRITADWGIAWRVTPLPGSALSYAVDHATWSVLISPDGQVRGTLPHGTAVDELARRIAAALAPPLPSPASPGG